MSDRREAVARAIEDADPDGPMRYDGEPDFLELEQDDLEKYFGMSDAAIAAMGLPAREEIEAALDDFNEAIIMEERGFCSEKAILAERQRLLAMIPMTEATDDR